MRDRRAGQHLPAGRWAVLGWASALALVYVVFVLTEPGQRLDAWGFGLAQGLGAGPLERLLPWLARRALPVAGLVVVAVLGLRALLRGRWQYALAGGTVVVVPTAVSPLLQEQVLWRPLFDEAYAYPYNTFPSTHVALVVGTLAAGCLLLPEGVQRVDGTVWTIVALAVLGNVVGHAHRPSDAVGAVLLVGMVSALVRPVVGRWPK